MEVSPYRDSLRQCRRGRARHRLEGLIGELCLVNPLSCSIPCIRVSIGRLSIWHGGDLVLNTYPEVSLKFHH